MDIVDFNEEKISLEFIRTFTHRVDKRSWYEDIPSYDLKGNIWDITEDHHHNYYIVFEIPKDLLHELINKKEENYHQQVLEKEIKYHEEKLKELRNQNENK